MCFLCVACVAWGCSHQDEEAGVVATVNGDPIYYDELKFTFDLANYGRTHEISSNSEAFRKEFGAALSDLIVVELIEQELEKKDLAVTDAEFDNASDHIFAGYGSKDRNVILHEENIDREMWERSLRRDLAFEKFLQAVIDPTLTVEVSEAAQYYKDHPEVFQQPRRIRFYFFQGPSENLLMEAAQLTLQAKSGDSSLPKSMEHIHREELFLSLDRIPKEWIEPIEQSRTLHKPIVFKTDMGVQGFVFIDDTPEQTLDAAKAFPVSEHAVLETKRKLAFSKWLAGVVQAADIAVSRHLLPDFSIANIVHDQADFKNEAERSFPDSAREQRNDDQAHALSSLPEKSP